eukprot:14175435-Ditylum_brightwellii.AAC.2
MGHLQMHMPVMKDNSTVKGIVNKNAKQHIARAIDIRSYWLCNRCAQKYFMVYWRPGSKNH